MLAHVQLGLCEWRLKAERLIMNENRMREMERAVPRREGCIVAQCRRGKIGLILKKTKTGYVGRVLSYTDADCEYRIMQIRNGRLLRTRWTSRDPFPIGYLPRAEVKILLDGGTVTRGCY